MVKLLTQGSCKPQSLKAFFRLIAVVLGSIHTYIAATNYSMNPDGIAYIEMGEAYVRGDWSTAVNAYWSPFYAWVLGAALKVVNPSMHWEFPVVHLINFLIYMVSLACFEFFWFRLMRYQKDQEGCGSLTLPGWAWLGLGYTLFMWSSLSLIKIWSVTPDMCVAAFVYLVGGFMIRMRHGDANWGVFALFGVVLGFGYLAKAAMFPLAFVFIGLSLFSLENMRRSIPRALVALTSFLLVASPLIVALSTAKGRLTFGDSGSLNYAKYVNGVPYPHWQSGPSEETTPKHPTRRIFDAPPIYEFGTPIVGSYPVSYDPSYWYEGVVPQFDWRKQLTVLVSSAYFFFDLFFRQQGVLIAGLLVLYALSFAGRAQMRNSLRCWTLAIVATAAFAMYGLVYVESRYIGAFVVLLWADLFARVRVPDSPLTRRLVLLSSAMMLTFMLINIAAFNLTGFYKIAFSGNTVKENNPGQTKPRWPGEVALALHQLGISPGSKVALIGYGFDAFWARLAGVKIVAEMFNWEADKFWLGDSAFQNQVISVFAGTGATAIVAEHVPTFAVPIGWHQVGQSSFYIHRLDS